MRQISFSSQFRRDSKRMQKRGKDMGKLKALILILAANAPIPRGYRDHPLKGNYAGRRDAHIEPDWVLIYALQENTLHLERTGTHADVFES